MKSAIIKEIIKQVIRIFGMLIVGTSVSLYLSHSFWLFILIWMIGWIIYDLNIWIK